MAAPPSPLADRYLIQRELGRGGMATVWLAQDTRDGRQVAIKVLNRELAGVVGVGRFLREINVISAIEHPGVAPVLDTGSLHVDGVDQPWYAMPFMEGGSLRERLVAERQLPVDEALRITTQLADALRSTHARGVIHRDIKPENILFSYGEPRLVDFGIAKALHDTADRLTSTGVSLGTLAYMSPEQIDGASADARTDQYSLAMVLYEMLAGEPPFAGMSAQAMIARRMAEPARSLLPLRSTVPRHIDRALLRALERAPADRFPDVTAFTDALQGTDRAITGSNRGRNWRWMAAGAVALVLALGAWRAMTQLAARRPAPLPEVVALTQRGTLAYQRRTPAGATDAWLAFSEAVRRDSASSAAWTGLAKTYVQAYMRSFPLPAIARDSVPTLAAAAVDAALRLDSANAEAWLARAQVSRLIDATNYEPVLRFARRSVALDSFSAEAWHGLAVFEMDAGNTDAAMAAWSRAVKAGPTHLLSLAFRGLGYYWQRQYDSAATWADSSVAVDNNYLLGRTTVGQVAVERGRYAEAEAAFEAARRLSTGVEIASADAFKALAQARGGDRRAARATVMRAESLAVRFAPTQAHTAAYMAHAYAALGDKAMALRWLQRYEVRGDHHFQLHLRCDPPLDPIAAEPEFRALLVKPRPPAGQGC